jgi:uncharacterized membrane protein
MEMVRKHIFWKTACWSAFAGLKSMSGPALLALDRKAVPNNSPIGQVLGSPLVVVGLGALAVGEMIADKLPFLPKRTSLPPLTARAFSGALIGASLYSAEELSAIEGAVVGCTSAVLTAYVSTSVRELLTKGLHIPDFLVALAEDTFIVTNGLRLISEELQEAHSDSFVDADSQPV